MRVLLVDDSEPFRDLLAQVAVAAGLEVAGAAGSGEEGLSLFEELRPDALIVDFRLPDMTGYDVADRVHVVSGAARVILVSATDSDREGVIPNRSLTRARLLAELGIGSSSS